MDQSIVRQLSRLSHEQRELLLTRLRAKTLAQLPAPAHGSADEDHGHSRQNINDVVILGGGVAGLTLALELARARPGASISVVERNCFPVSETIHKVGESTVEIAAHYLRDVLGLEEHLTKHQIRKFGLRMFFTAGDNSDITSRRELGPSKFPPLATYQLDRGRLENELANRCRHAGITLVTDIVRSADLGRGDQPHLVTLANGMQLAARWVIDATGRASRLRRELGHESIDNGHHSNAAWFRIDHPIDVRGWSTDDDWRARISEGDRSTSTVHLMGDHYWVWLIRLPSGATSVGIVADATAHDFTDFNTFDRALDWLFAHEPQCAAVIEQHRDRVMDFRVMRDYSYACERVVHGAGRWALTGEAALFLDPLYSPGLDLIAIGNGLITDLVRRSLNGEDVAGLAEAHNKLYLTICDVWLGIYRSQYALMGKPAVMTSKVIWDTAFYWAVFGFLFFQGGFKQVAGDPVLVRELDRLTVLSNRVQQLFREWATVPTPTISGDFVDLYSPLDFMIELHHAMARDSDSSVAERLQKNRITLEQLAGQLVDVLIGDCAQAPTDEAIALVQSWQRDPIITGLRRVHRVRRADAPTANGWIRPVSNPDKDGEESDVDAA